MRKEVWILLLILAAVVAGGYFAAKYYRNETVTKAPPPKPELKENLVRPDSAYLGPADAKVTVVEYYDPECETCARVAPMVKGFVKEFPQVRFVFRYVPFHKNARTAVIYTEAAGDQGKYWEMQDKLFVTQPEWGDKHGHGPQPANQPPVTVLFDKYAQEIGLNMEQLKASVNDPKHGQKADRDMKDGQTLGVTQTPTFFVNGRKLVRLDMNDLRSMINMELNR